MDEDVRLSLGIDQATMSSVEIVSIVDMLPYNSQLKTIQFRMLWIEFTAGVVSNDLQRSVDP